MESEMRQKFEAWARRSYTVEQMRSDPQGVYFNGEVQMRFGAFCAGFIAGRPAGLREAAGMLNAQRYRTLEPLRTYTSEVTWQYVRDSVKCLAARILRRADEMEKGR